MSEKQSLHQDKLNITLTNRDNSKINCSAAMQAVKNEEIIKSFDIKISASELGNVKDFKLAFVAKNININGFRAGKAPLNIVWQKNQESLTSEIINDLIQAVNQTLREKNSLNLTDSPKVTMKEFDFDKGLEFEISFETMPEIETPSLEKISLNKPVVNISEDDIKERLTELKNKIKNFKATEKDYLSSNGDKVVIDFEGRIDNIAFPGGTAKNHSLELGSKSFIDNFEQQLLKHKAGDEVLVKVTFPENYHEPKYAGKNAEFSVTIHSIEQASAFDSEADFAKHVGFDSIEALHKVLKQQIETECSNIIVTKMKTELFDQLDKMCNFPLPPSIVDEEFKNLWQKIEQMKHNNQIELDKPEDKIKEEYLSIAKRRVKLGLLLSQLSSLYDIKVEEHDISNEIRARAMANPAMAQYMIKYYTENPKAIEQLKGPILEGKTVRHIFTLVNNIEKPITVKQLLEEATAQ